MFSLAKLVSYSAESLAKEIIKILPIRQVHMVYLTIKNEQNKRLNFVIV